MKYIAVVVSIFVLLIQISCSSVLIIPKPVTPGATVNPADQSIKINNSGLTVSARVQDTAVGGYEIDTAMAAFYLTINNQTHSNVQVALDAFNLTDSDGVSHKPVAPEDVNAILHPEISYFLPYPFVGYYDVVDLEQHRATSAMASERPYVGAGLSAIDALIPLPIGSINNGQQISGMLYFNIEIIDLQSFELKASLPAGGTGRDLVYIFPYSVEK